MRNLIFVKAFLIYVLVFACNAACASDEHMHDEHSHEDHTYEVHEHEDDAHGEHLSHEEHSHSDQVIVSASIVQQTGIATDLVAPQTIQVSTKVYGVLTSGSEQLSHVRARFPGLITDVSASIGDYVEAGDLLAKVESNESLKVYQMRAPISGMIIQRHANRGEYTENQILFSIAELQSLWAELRIFSKQELQVSKGQKVTIFSDHGSLESTVEHIIPAIDKPYSIARAKLENSNNLLTPGMLVEAQIYTNEFVAPLAVKKQAIQTLEGMQGVFIKNEQTYTFTPIAVGRSDSNFTEVLSGLSEGQQYVVENSYILKADIEKSSAEHHH